MFQKLTQPIMRSGVLLLRTKMARNKLETDFDSPTQPQMFAKIMGIENRQVFLPHSLFG